MEIRKDLERFIAELISEPGFEAGALATKDGILLASELPGKVEVESFAAMSATLLASGEEIIKQYADGNLNSIVLKGDESKFLLEEISDNIILIARVSKEIDNELREKIDMLKTNFLK
ncbi:hypothetical protein C9439_00395 [archaeon SCG-AAA382B04]|nr:hypothetical protein C9439_00395 [archaeon SCG-AAA382B04]